MGARILLVDDELGALKSLTQHLQGAGYELLTASDLDEALYLLRTASPDLVILDIRFGRSERMGLDILEEIRTGVDDQSTPVLMLRNYHAITFPERRALLPQKPASSEKVIAARILTGVGEEELEPRSFDLGATDFVRKSTGTRALLARIRARLPRPATEPMVIDERLRVDLVQAEVFVARSGQWQVVRLEPKQAELLKKLVCNPGRVLRREQLEDLFDDAEDPSRALNTCISRLREILEPDPREPFYLQTRRGIGYKFRDYR